MQIDLYAKGLLNHSTYKKSKIENEIRVYNFDFHFEHLSGKTI